MNKTTIWDFILPISCGILLVEGANLLLSKSYLAGSIVLPLGIVLMSIRLGYCHYKDKQDAKMDDEKDDMLDAIITKLGITPEEIEEQRIKLRRNNEN